jgi:hypothetical protein
MLASTQPASPEVLFGVMAITGLVIGRLILWVREATPRPKPWCAEVGKGLQQPNAIPICHRCFTPQDPGAWFCENCGRAIGPYNNLMPYINVFSQGEVLRNGVTDRLRTNPLTIVGYVRLSLQGYLVFAPVYWFFLAENLRRSHPVDSEEPESPQA